MRMPKRMGMGMGMRMGSCGSQKCQMSFKDMDDRGIIPRTMGESMTEVSEGANKRAGPHKQTKQNRAAPKQASDLCFCPNNGICKYRKETQDPAGWLENRQKCSYFWFPISGEYFFLWARGTHGEQRATYWPTTIEVRTHIPTYTHKYIYIYRLACPFACTIRIECPCQTGSRLVYAWNAFVHIFIVNACRTFLLFLRLFPLSILFFSLLFFLQLF